MGVIGDIIRNGRGENAPRRDETASRDTHRAPAPRFETKVIRIATRGPLGMKAPELRKLEALLADGWEVVSQKGGFIGARMTTYVLRRQIW